MSDLVVGAGEVGTAIARHLSCYRHVDTLDADGRDSRTDGTEYNLVHIAFRWGESFVRDVAAYAAEYPRALVVVHSTVPIGTCDANGWVHSPVRGRHPDLLGGVATFVKHFGGAEARLAARLWPGVTIAHDTAATTEAGKLLELLHLGVEVMVSHYAQAVCEAAGVDYVDAWQRFADTYTEGYEQLNDPRFRRPALDYVAGPIGGHCVVPGVGMLAGALPEMVLEFQRQEEGRDE